ncbi:MAG TPA: MFS transporter [Actinomycetales bacterium]|nr:MFS transporter [Actinomycetales bacterium]
MKRPLQRFHRSVWRHRDLRVVGPARALSVLGDEMALVALLLAVHDSGGGARGISLLLASAAIPTVLLAPWAGRLADRWDSRVLTTVSALAQGLVCAALALAIAGEVPAHPWLLYVLVALLHAGQAVANPTWGALVPKIVGDGEVGRALGATQALTTVAAVAGPALGGVLTGLGGARLPLLADTATFGALAVAGLVVRTRRGERVVLRGRRRPRRAAQSAATGAAGPASPVAKPRALDGLRVVRRDVVLWPLFTSLMAFVVVGEATNVVEVFLVRDSLHGTDTAYGLIGMAAAAGIAVGSLLGGRDATTRRRLRWIVLAAGAMATCLVVAGLAPTLLVMAAAWSLLGIANGALNTSTSTLLLTRVPDAARGQVIAAMMGASRGFSIGALALGGLAAAAIGPRATFVVSGALALAVTAMLALRVLRVRVDAQVPDGDAVGMTVAA